MVKHAKIKPISINEVENNKVMVFDKTSYGNKGFLKYYIGYLKKTEAFPSPLCIKLPQLIGHTKYFTNDNRSINLLANDKKLLKKYNGIWDKINSLSKNKFSKEPFHCKIINILMLK